MRLASPAACRLARGVALLLAGTQDTGAECVEAPPVCEALRTSDLVFHGEVVSAQWYLNGGQDDVVEFRVIRPFKGATGDYFVGTFDVTAESVQFAPGMQLVLYADGRNGRWSTACSRRAVGDRIAEELAALSGCGVASPGTSDALVEQLRPLPTPIPALARSDGTIDPVEERRRVLYTELRRHGDAALPALARGLADPDVRLRKNVALALAQLGGGWFDTTAPKMNIAPALPALVAALEDDDDSVRAWSAQAIGTIGAGAASAVPALVRLLARVDEGSRISACLGLSGIGRPAREALPALRHALSDASPDVRRCAGHALARIESR